MVQQNWLRKNRNRINQKLLEKKHATIDNDGEYTPVNTREKYRVSFFN